MVCSKSVLMIINDFILIEKVHSSVFGKLFKNLRRTGQK